MILIKGRAPFLEEETEAHKKISIVFKYLSMDKGETFKTLNCEPFVLSSYLPHFIDNRYLTVSRMYYIIFSYILKI